MANVIDLKDRARTPKRTLRTTEDHGEKGRVLLFTGVRYERLQPASQPMEISPRLVKP